MAAVVFGWELEKSCELVRLTFIGIMSLYKITATSGTTLMLKYASSQQECFLHTEDIQSGNACAKSLKFVKKGLRLFRFLETFL